jgi:L-amino acid N-acyltransferase YncA
VPHAGAVRIRSAEPDDAGAIARIYNEGIEEREATLETRARSERDFLEPIANADALPFLVAEEEGSVLAWAAVKPYSEREAYAHVVECMLYVARFARGQGIATRLLDALALAAERAGYAKLVGRLFTSNAASIALVRRCGFDEVGVHRRHGRLEGEWRDVLVVERLLGEASEKIP